MPEYHSILENEPVFEKMFYHMEHFLLIALYFQLVEKVTLSNHKT